MGFITLNEYETTRLSELFQVLDEIGGFDTGDWYGQIKYKCGELNHKTFGSEEAKKLLLNNFKSKYTKNEDNTVK